MLKAIFYDLDGPILDSRQATIDYFQRTLEHYNLPVASPEQFKPLLGLKARDILKNVTPSLSGAMFEEVFEYSKEMSIDAISKIQLIPGASTTLGSFHRWFKQALVTNRGKTSVTLLLKKFDLVQYFDLVIDREDIINHKPDPEGLIKALNIFGISPEEALYAGDTQEDVLAAKAAGIPCIIITEETETFDAEYAVPTLKDTQWIIEGLLNKEGNERKRKEFY